MTQHQLYNTGTGHWQVLADLTFVHAEGSWLTDERGRKYIDLAMNSSLPLGHDQDLLRRAFAANDPLNAGKYGNAAKLELLELLHQLLPTFSAFQFYSAGSLGNEGLMRYATAITGRSGFVGFAGSFHGHTRATASLREGNDYHGRRVSGFVVCPYPGYDDQSGGASDARALPGVDEIADAIDQHGSDDIAGVLVEPILGKVCIEPPPGWLRDLKERVLEPRGILLMMDEYLTAVRVGDWLATSRLGILPDLVNVGKCFKTGVPFAAIACHERWASEVARVKGEDTSSGQGPICRNALLTISRLRDERLLERSASVAKTFTDVFEDMISTQKVARLFARGALCYLELSSEQFALDVAKAALDRGVLVAAIKKGLRFTPALTIDTDTFRSGLETVRSLIESTPDNQ